MKKIFLTILFLFIPFYTQCAEMPKDITGYLGKTYIGMSYNEAYTQPIPFLLIFANPKDVTSIIKLTSLGEMVYNEFKGQYNFCIMSTKAKENKKLIDAFEYDSLPALFIVDTNDKTYTYVEKRYYKKRALREILTEFKKGTL